MADFLFAVSNGLMWGAIIALIACGLSIVFTFLSIVNLAHGDFYMLGAFIAYYIISKTTSFWIALLISPVVVAIIAIMLFSIFIKNSNRYISSNSYLIATFGMSLVLQNVILFIFGGYPIKVDPPISYTITLFGNPYPSYRVFITFVSFLIFILYFIFIEKTKFGLWLRATGENYTLAKTLGISTKTVTIIAIGMGAYMAGFAGILVAPVLSIEYRMGNNILLLAFIVTVLGGFGNIRGIFIAGLLYGICEGALIYITDPIKARTILIGLCCLFILINKTGIYSPIKVINRV